MSDYQRVHDALTDKGFKPDDDLFTMYEISCCINQLEVRQPPKKEDKTKTRLKKELYATQEQLKQVNQQIKDVQHQISFGHRTNHE